MGINRASQLIAENGQDPDRGRERSAIADGRSGSMPSATPSESGARERSERRPA
jgi:hypothetical protein